MTALYELAASYRHLSDKLRDIDLPDEVVADTLEAESGEITEKGINVAKMFRNMEADAEKIEDAAKDMMDRACAIRKRSAKLKQYLFDNMMLAGISKIECPWFVISIKQNPESVTVEDEASIPRDYFKEIPATYKLDKTLVKKAIKDGYEVPGCHLQRTTRLEIK